MCRNSKDNKLFPFALEDVIEAIGSNNQQRTQDWPPPDKNSGGGDDPEVVFNVLDAILKCSLERLKIMRLDSRVLACYIMVWVYMLCCLKTVILCVLSTLFCRTCFHPSAFFSSSALENIGSKT